MFLEVFKVKNKKELARVVADFSSYADDVYNAREKEVLKNLENDVQKIIFLDWWNGGHLWEWSVETKQHDRAERYRYVSDHDWETVSSWCLETCSLGMG